MFLSTDRDGVVVLVCRYFTQYNLSVYIPQRKLTFVHIRIHAIFVARIFSSFADSAIK